MYLGDFVQGRIADYGTYEELLEKGTDFASLMNAANKDNRDDVDFRGLVDNGNMQQGFIFDININALHLYRRKNTAYKGENNLLLLAQLELLHMLQPKARFARSEKKFVGRGFVSFAEALVVKNFQRAMKSFLVHQRNEINLGV